MGAAPRARLAPGVCGADIREGRLQVGARLQPIMNERVDRSALRRRR